VIGEVTDTGHMVLEWNGEVVCDIPLAPLADEAPLYDRPYVEPRAYKAWAAVKPLGEAPEHRDVGADLLRLMATPTSPAASGSGSSTTARSAPTRCSCRAATPRWCASTARARRWR
jgi:phosphoribosylformylglycinamidine (FGAM) synthase-like enzyme